ncbi:LPS export ABC transporter permease LptF [Xinfangfangia sp. CPCC 101601]|uniref:LPS export ABC transporter permease LptF n=1 Tax=Pseudogemmobacter lacusdianii TaxID=3069608 RepID=A0ABU0VWP2_9RHOB|nr:LPS export ABC transporter permease LptF [Xinfangfangia sp. CPCC 101601]MDQ2065605.1 LPS export ABC transporter permease LptF [Xinfangfangia sp. CPCC 101601]
MSRFDRYLLSHLLALFGFFSLVLVAVYWVNRAVGLFDQLIGDGQSAVVFVEFSLLTLPNVIRLVLPVSAFAACLYAINRLAQESELVVMQATGFSAFRLARPVLYFGLSVMAMQMVLTHVLVPLSSARLGERTSEISANATAQFLKEGSFMHPTAGITLYISEISQLGELQKIFLADDRGETERLVYTAETALMVRGETGPVLVMIDGAAQRLTREGQRLALTRFENFAMDLSGLVSTGDARRISLRELSTAELLKADPAMLEETRGNRAYFFEEAHSRFASPLLALAAPLLGFAALMLGSYSRFGLLPQIGLAVGLLIVVQTISTLGSGRALESDNGWPLVYAAPLTGLALSAFMLWLAQRPRRRPKAQAEVPA